MDTAKAKLGASFCWLNATQFLGALNDNVFKLLIILFLIGPEKDPAVASRIAAIAGIVFVVPFLLFIAFAGKVADRFSKRNIIVCTKAGEVAVMLLGCAAFSIDSSVAAYCVLFLMCTQSTFFSPSKYGIVRELVADYQLSRANGLLTAMTYLAIVIGTASGLLLSSITNERYVMLGFVCVFVAFVGLLVSLPIKRTPPAGGHSPASILFVRDIWRTLWSIHRNRDLLLAVFASAYFMLIGGFLYTNLIPFGMDQLGFDKQQSAMLFIVAAVGIGVGSFLAGKLSVRHVELGIVPLGAIGLSVFSAALGLLPAEKYTAFAIVFVLGISAGLFIVPIRAFIQLKSPRKRLGEVLAASSFLGWICVLLASVLIYFFGSIIGMSASQLFVLLAVITMILAVIATFLLPDFFVRLLCVLLTRLCYRIKVTGAENVPVDRGALLICNHVSWVDALLVTSTQQRRIRFVMDKSFYNKWWLRPISSLMGVIPISSSDRPKEIVASLRAARQAIDDGFLVCIFAEGMITRSGMMGRFRAGFERIVKGSDYGIIPVYLGGVWGSIFSYYNGKVLSMLPKKFPFPVSIHFGKAMPSYSSASRIRQSVSELGSEYFDGLKSPGRSLASHFVKSARKNWRRRCVCDSTGKRLNYGQTLTMSLALADRICGLPDVGDKVGILLPPSTAGALANLATTLCGKIAVNLNYTSGEKAQKFAIEQCELKYIISSREFIESLGRKGAKEKTKVCGVDFPGLVFIEDIASEIKLGGKVKAYLKASLLPIGVLMRGRQRHSDDVATVIFSSGSSGRPKGVMLSHHNIISNIEAVRMAIQIRADDNLCGVLPFFHSFGFNCALWLPLISGVSASFVANPLDGAAVAVSVRQNRSTILFAPPTFLLNYVRRASRSDFACLRLVAAGAEKLKKRLADSFEAKFGIRPLEGYGATELSPVVSLNIPDVESDGVYQVGSKADSVGHPIPGVTVKAVGLESREPLGDGDEGLLLVKGPNVMAGYLNMPKETAEVFEDGWYNTGDIGRIDEDGFVTITDRLSRFSKIGGEMVPHIAVEEAYLHGLGTHEQVIAVTSVPDPKKGEELVVLHLAEAGSAEQLHEIIAKSKIPNMWKPRRSNYIEIESMPALGSGKLDVMKLRKIALAARNESQR